MGSLSTRSQLWPAAAVTFVAALVLFVFTIVVGILNGLDVYDPDHDTLLTHVHAGTLGWITLSVAGTALIMFTKDRTLDAGEVGRGTTLAWAITGAITLYVAAFFAGDRIPGDRIARPIFGTLLLIVTVWFAAWLFQSNGRFAQSSIARLGVILAWISLMVGAVLGVILGIYTSQSEVPGLSNDTAEALAEAHPPAMVIGFLILAAMAIIEWLLRGDQSWAETRLGAAQMWMLFVAGVVINIAFIANLDQELLGPANLLMIAGVVIMLVRYRADLVPAGWRDAGTGMYPRLAALFAIAYLVLLTIVVVLFVTESMDIDALEDWEEGLILAFDHTMFVGVMTLLLFGVISTSLHGSERGIVDSIVAWGVTIGIIGFAAGLLSVNAPLKRIFTPLMGLSLLTGIAAYIPELWRSRTASAGTEAPARVET